MLSLMFYRKGNKRNRLNENVFGDNFRALYLFFKQQKLFHGKSVSPTRFNIFIVKLYLCRFAHRSVLCL